MRFKRENIKLSIFSGNIINLHKNSCRIFVKPGLSSVLKSKPSVSRKKMIDDLMLVGYMI